MVDYLSSINYPIDIRWQTLRQILACQVPLETNVVAQSGGSTSSDRTAKRNRQHNDDIEKFDKSKWLRGALWWQVVPKLTIASRRCSNRAPPGPCRRVQMWLNRSTSRASHWAIGGLGWTSMQPCLPYAPRSDGSSLTVAHSVKTHVSKTLWMH